MVSLFMATTPKDAEVPRAAAVPRTDDGLDRSDADADADTDGRATSSGEHLAPRCPHCGEHHPSSYSHCPRSGKPLQAGPALVGRVIAGRYRVTGILGEGGMGAVYIAEHLLLGRKVAIKRLHPELAGDEKAIARFQREARAAAATGHEHIVDVMDLGYAEDGAPYLVMEYLRGVSLAQTLKRETRLPLARTIRIVTQVLAALASVHERGIVHRDLKPDNVFLTRRGNVPDYVKVLDFGISKVKQEEGEPNTLTRTGVTMGTPFYMSPEQARGVRKLDHRVDLYAVAVITYECLTGRLPLMGDNYHALLQQILGVDPIPPASYLPGLPAEVDAAVMKGLAKDPQRRFASAAEMLAVLAPFGGEGTERHLAVTRPGAAAIEDDSAERVDARAPTEAVPPEEGSSPGGTRASGASGVGLPRWTRDTGSGGARPLGSSSPRVEPAALGSMRPSPSDTSERFDAAARSTGTPARGFRSTPVPMESSPSYFFAASEDWSGEVPTRARRGGSSSGEASTTSDGARRPPARAASPGHGIHRVAEPSPERSNEDDLVRGALVSGLLAHLGTARATRATNALPVALRERIGPVILPMEWLPLALFDALLATFGADAPEQVVMAGRVIASKELSTTHQLLVHNVEASTMLERIPYLMRLYFSAMSARVTPMTGGVRLVLEGRAPESSPLVAWHSGFWQRVMEMAGARDVRVGSTECRSRGDLESAITLRWR